MRTLYLSLIHISGFQINLRLQVIGDVSAFQSGTDALLQIKIAKIIIFIGQAVDFKMGISESALRTFTSADIRIVLGSIEINGSPVSYTHLDVYKRQDMTKYFIIYVIPCVLTGLSNRLYEKRYCRLKIRINKEIQFHLKALFPIFFSNIATIIYINSDITMLGILCGEKSVGLYSISTKIYNVGKNIFFARCV